jgi:hypothetical protein
MLTDKAIIGVDAIFMYKPNYLIKRKEDIKLNNRTSYCNYHFRQALLGLENDFTGKTKPQIEKIMLKNTGYDNFQHISNLKREVKKSKLPIEVEVGVNKPFKVIILDNSILKDSPANEKSKKNDAGYIPSQEDVETALRELGGMDVEVDDLLDRIEHNCLKNDLQLKKRWRKKTRNNIDKWVIS